MRTALLVCLVCVVATLLVPAALAQERVIAMEKGKTMLSGTAMLNLDETSNWSTDLYYQKFVTDQVALGLLLGLSHTEEGTGGLLGLRAEHNFFNKERPSRAVPYVAGMVVEGWQGGDSATGAGLAAGVKLFVSENTFVAPELDWIRIEGESFKYLMLTVGTLY